MPGAGALITSAPLALSGVAVAAIGAMCRGRMDNHVLVDPELAHAKIVAASALTAATPLRRGLMG